MAVLYEQVVLMLDVNRRPLVNMPCGKTKAHASQQPIVCW